jgi:tetratricopeptide (TPR) repeat protein
MRLMRTMLIVAAALLMSAAAPSARAADAGGGKPGVAQEKERQRLFGLIREAVRKQKAGEKLTGEEQAALNKARAFQQEMRKRRAKEQAAARARKGLRLDDRLNIVDMAYYQIAGIHLNRKQYDQVAATLEQLIKKSPDKAAVSLTHFNLAELYRTKLNNKERAVAEYKLVTGRYAAYAMRRLASLFEETKEIDEAVEQLEALGKTSKDNAQKVMALKELAALLTRSGRHDEAIAALRTLIGAVSYDEAAEVSKVLQAEAERREQKTQKAFDRSRRAAMRRAQRRPQGPRPDGGGAARPDAKPRRVRPDAPDRDR